MDYGRLGERQRAYFPIVEIVSFLLLLGAIILIMLEVVDYGNQRDDLPTDLTVAGIAAGGLNEADAQARWESIYVQQPLQLYYGGNLILLYPNEVGFRTDNEAMLAEAHAQNAQEKNYWAGFWNYLGRRPVAAVSVPLRAAYDEGLLRAYLDDLATRYNDQPGEAAFDQVTLTFSSGLAGRQLDVDAALPLIEAALFDPEPTARRIILPTSTTTAQQQDMATLRQGINTLLFDSGFDYDGGNQFASVYIMDLTTGEEIKVLADVPHSARSVIKIPIMVNLFREELLVPSGTDIAYLLTESILCSNNSASNYIVQYAGAGANERSQQLDGLNQVSCTAQALGAEHTYMSALLWVGDSSLEFEAPVCRPETPGSLPTAANPDPFAQTTAQDMGVLLTGIYDCVYHDSGLRAIYPDEITQRECQHMLNLLSGNHIDRLIELGLPPGTPLAHKNGWGIETSVDSGIVFSPGGDYVISIFTWEYDADGNALPTLASWELIEELSRLTWNYFNPDQPLLQPREPLNPLGAIDCVTVSTTEDVNLDDIDMHRLDANGLPLSTACYGGAGNCRPFDNWGAGPTPE
ncbi:MAG: class A beta-lactamase-related serine hydrolase [Anaerolineae bacterium]|nr:class A beta-lactamase-related serine hydrolase [Anaerolineae bacterium]